MCLSSSGTLTEVVARRLLNNGVRPISLPGRISTPDTGVCPSDVRYEPCDIDFLYNAVTLDPSSVESVEISTALLWYFVP